MIDVYSVICKLVGPISPIGASHVDCNRLDNLEQLTGIMDQLMADIHEVAGNKDSHMGSVKKAGQHADEFLRSHGILP